MRAHWSVAAALAMLSSACAHFAADEGCRFGSPSRCLDLSELSARSGEAASERDALEAACRRGLDEGCFFFALALEQGPSADPARARSVLQEACARGHRPSCNWPAVSVPDVALTCEAREGNGLEKAELHRFISAHSEQVRTCYEATLQDGEVEEGAVALNWRINSEGRVISAQVTKNSFSSGRVARCVQRSVLTWRFPCPAGGGFVDVTFPYEFRAAKDP